MSSIWLLVALMAGHAEPAQSPELATGIKLEAGGAPIDVEVGHAAPYFVDFDEDGTKDLLVG